MATPALRLHQTPADAAAAIAAADVAAAEAHAAVTAPRAYAEVIDAYWDDVDGRVGYLLALLDIERHSEALSLCATYLEGVTHFLVTTSAAGPAGGADESEVLARDPYLSLVHPLQVVRIAGAMMGLSAATVQGLAVILDTPVHQLLYREQAVEIVRSSLPPSEATLLERVLWKCTIGYIVFDFLKAMSFHRGDQGRRIGLGSGFYEGATMLGFSVPELVALLHGMVAEARARSHATGTLPATA